MSDLRGFSQFIRLFNLLINKLRFRILLISWFGVLSWLAMRTRTVGVRAIVLIGVVASLYSLFLFFTNSLAPDSPKASHDLILKARWASPAPSEMITIVDIDERSLAILAPEHGRWPWARSVLADGLQRLTEAGVRGTLFNVLMSDPDKLNPDADNVMEVVAALTPNASFPAIRLNPDNDAISQLLVDELLRRTGDSLSQSDRTVAIILPMFNTMLDRVGIANQKPDADGIIRKYPVIWNDNTLTMPSIVARTLLVSGDALPSSQRSINLNWRNKAGRYKRVSFADLLMAPPDDPILKDLKDSYIILGVSAPGVGMTKPTSVRAIEDDNEILATALDDILHGTHLRVMPAWLVLFIELATVWAIVWVALGRSFGGFLNKSITALQVGGGSITMLSVSYTNYLIDLSSCMIIGLAIFAYVKAITTLDNGWSRARPGLRNSSIKNTGKELLLIGYKDSEVNGQSAEKLQRTLESKLGLASVIKVDDLFGGDSFLRSVCEDYSCQLCVVGSEICSTLVESLQVSSFFPSLVIQRICLQIDWNPDSNEFKKFVAPYFLHQCADLISRSEA